jgi:hypothetical protein
LRTSEIDGLMWPWGWTHVKAFSAIFHIDWMSNSLHSEGSMIPWISPLSMCNFACHANMQLFKSFNNDSNFLKWKELSSEGNEVSFSKYVQLPCTYRLQINEWF